MTFEDKEIEYANHPILVGEEIGNPCGTFKYYSEPIFWSSNLLHFVAWARKYTDIYNQPSIFKGCQVISGRNLKRFIYFLEKFAETLRAAKGKDVAYEHLVSSSLDADGKIVFHAETRYADASADLEFCEKLLEMGERARKMGKGLYFQGY